MIRESVEPLLEQWGAWVLGDCPGAVRSSWVDPRCARSGEFGPRIPLLHLLPSSEKMRIIDELAARIEGELLLVMMKRYIHHQSVVSIAEEIGLSRRMVYYKLEALHRQVFDALHPPVTPIT